MTAFALLVLAPASYSLILQHLDFGVCYFSLLHCSPVLPAAYNSACLGSCRIPSRYALIQHSSDETKPSNARNNALTSQTENRFTTFLSRDSKDKIKKRRDKSLRAWPATPFLKDLNNVVPYSLLSNSTPFSKPSAIAIAIAATIPSTSATSPPVAYNRLRLQLQHLTVSPQPLPLDNVILRFIRLLPRLRPQSQ